MTEPSEPIFPVGENDRHLAAHFFNPNRLLLAREFKGYQQKELAELVGKTSGAISQFESGTARPDVSTLAALALALAFPIGFFAQRDRIALLSTNNCHFRSLRSASEKEKRQALAAGSLLGELFYVLEEFIELPKERVSTLTQVPILTLEDIEDLAADVRRQWGLGYGPIPHLVKLLETKGIIVSFVTGNSKKLDAFSAWQADRPHIFLTTEKGSASRSRLNAAHELGHLIMHRKAIPGDKERELEANRFASAFLIPREPFLAECPRWLNWDHFYEMKRRWKVSVAALVKRAYDLDCITEASYRRAFMQLSQRGEKQSEKHEPSHEEPSLLERSLELLSDLPTQSVISALCWGEKNFHDVKETTRVHSA